MSTPQHILTILAVRDVQIAKAFYLSVFQWDITIDEPMYVQFALPRGLAIGIYTRDGFSSNTHAAPLDCSEQSELTTGTELYLRCDDLEKVIKRMTNIQARLLATLEVKPWGDEVAYFADPDGNVLALTRSEVEC